MMSERYERDDEMMSHDVPICPHCKVELEDEWELELDDDDYTNVECPECGKEYHVLAHVRYSYDTRYTREQQDEIISKEGKQDENK